MKVVAVTLALLATGANALSDRELMVEEINSKNTTWHAAVSDKFRNTPLGSHKNLYGAKSVETAELVHAISKGDLKVAPILADAAKIAAIPDSFDSAENWPECSKVINDIRDQSNCGCCWAFGAAGAASDRACIASGGEILAPFSAEDVCFSAESNGCNGGSLLTPWMFIGSTGVVTGNQQLEDAAVDAGLDSSDPFYGMGFCSPFSLPHCFHHGPENTSPYPAEGDAGCPSQKSPSAPTSCDDSASDDHSDYKSDKYSHDGSVYIVPSDVATIQNTIMSDGPVEAAFTVYSDFEEYAGGIYQHVTGSTEGGHAIRIVGWGSEDGVDYWKVANSWNPYWGEKGYFRILRGANECGIEDQVYASTPGASWGKVSEMRTPKAI